MDDYPWDSFCLYIEESSFLLFAYTDIPRLLFSSYYLLNNKLDVEKYVVT